MWIKAVIKETIRPSLYLFAFYLAAGCAALPKRITEIPPDGSPVYETLSSDISLMRASQYVVVDDFNSGTQLKNQMGHDWLLETTGKSRAIMDISDEDSRAAQRGHSLQINLDIYPRDRLDLTTSLGNLDMSQAQYIVLKFRGAFQDIASRDPQIESPLETYFDAKVMLTLRDTAGRTAMHDITELCIASHKGWNDVIVPMTLLKGLNTNQLKEVSMSILGRMKRVRGRVWIDEVAFYGPKNLEFENKRDNLHGFPLDGIDSDREQWLLEKAKKKSFKKVLLMEIARDTWKYFLNARDKNTHLVVDHVRLGKTPLAADYTSITNIAMDFMGTVAAYDLGFIERPEAVKRIRETFGTMKKLKRWKGFFYNYYRTRDLSVSPNFISSVDSGWLAVSLVVVRQAFARELGRQATAFLNSFNFSEFVDPVNNQFAIGFDEDKGELTPYHYGLLISEARTAYVYAIGKGDVPADIWWFIYRTPPDSWDWQNQKPQGKYKMQDGMEYFQGYYEHDDKKFLPSWGGSLFEFLMPTLVLKERELAPEGLGLNNRIATEIQRDYALKKKNYPIWGISPASTGDGRGWQYVEYGVKDVSVKGYPDKRVITPHVTFLALDSLPEDAIENIRNLFDFNMYGEYGFYDSIDLRRRRVNPQYLALDQGMTLVALANYLKKGSIQNRFHADEIGKNAENLLINEAFFKDN